MEHKNLLLRKGVFPYEWCQSWEQLKNTTELPARELFYSNLTGEHVSETDYKHAQNVWKTFNICTMDEYCELYCKTDVALLAEAFISFRRTNIDIHKLDCWYV
jgi:hypothetical protein